MMRLAHMARVEGFFSRMYVLIWFKQFPQDLIKTNGAFLVYHYMKLGSG